ncbi:acyl-protein thioesterase [Trichoderma harzianum]|uniref:Acyl-protein thioesterase n=1 Tax=Trichoderma harzianum TaxID=5544 RepID=A0A0F9Y207_TRIHA|nr:acyl-protein thioesterase [Trichoderma harzianum]
MVADLPLTTIPPSRPHTHTVIFLHDNRIFARDTVNQLHEATDLSWRSIIQNFASTRWVFPQAPTDEPLIPSVLSISTGIQHGVHRGQPSWWRGDMNDGDEERRLRNMLPGLRERVRELQKVIRNEVVMLGGRWDRIILGGIGHGAGMALMALVSLEGDSSMDVDGSRPQRLGTFVGISGQIPVSDIRLSSAQQLFSPNHISPAENQVLKKTPLLLQYCRNAGEAYVEQGRTFREVVLESGVEDVCWKEYEDAFPFLNSPRGVEDMKGFFRDKMNMRPNW